MAGEQANDPRRDLKARAIEKAAREAAFREELLRDPRGAIERELSVAAGRDVRLPADLRVVVHEETADTLHLVLPPAAADGEISYAELSGVAGGNDVGFFNAGNNNWGFGHLGGENLGSGNTGDANLG